MTRERAVCNVAFYFPTINNNKSRKNLLHLAPTMALYYVL
jgi:hypothetical protein